MTTWKTIAPVFALSLSTAIAGAGCLAQADRDEASEIAAAQDDAADTTATGAQAAESTGAAHEALFCGLPFIHCGTFPFGFGSPGFLCRGVGVGLGWPFFIPRGECF